MGRKARSKELLELQREADSVPSVAGRVKSVRGSSGRSAAGVTTKSQRDLKSFLADSLN